MISASARSTAESCQIRRCPEPADRSAVAGWLRAPSHRRGFRADRSGLGRRHLAAEAATLGSRRWQLLSATSAGAGVALPASFAAWTRARPRPRLRFGAGERAAVRSRWPAVADLAEFRPPHSPSRRIRRQQHHHDKKYASNCLLPENQFNSPSVRSCLRHVFAASLSPAFCRVSCSSAC